MGLFYVLIVLVTGFIFTRLYLPARLRQQRSEGWDSYFHIAAWGTFFLAASFVILIVTAVSSFGLNLTTKLITFHTESFILVTLSLAVILAALAALLINATFFRKNSDRYYQQIANVIVNDHIEALLMESCIDQRPILITLANNKIYIGISHDTFSCITNEMTSSSIAILPLRSGYRSVKRKKLKVINDYNKHYGEMNSTEGFDVDDFRVVIPKSEIISISFYDSDSSEHIENECSYTPKNQVTATSYSTNSTTV